jgi:hypothetical protein
MIDVTPDEVIQTRPQQNSAASDQHYAFKDLALLQAFSNVMLTSFSTVSNRWAGGDFTSWTIFCAFYLAATSDTTRSILHGTSTATSPIQDGLLS